KSLGSRAMAIFAGPLFNFILAFFIFLAIGLLHGIPTNEPIIKEVISDSPAYAAGMEAGDFVKEVDGKPIASWQEFTETVQVNPGNRLQMKVERNGELVTLQVVPEKVVKEGNEFGQIGVMYESPVEKNALKAFAFGAEQTYSWMKRIFELLGMLVTGKFTKIGRA